MFDHTAIVAAINDKVSWRVAPDPEQWQLSPTPGVKSLSWQSAHPLLTLLNLQSVAPRFNEIHSDPADRDLAFTKWLGQKVSDGVVEMLAAWSERMEDSSTGRELLDSGQIFDDGIEVGYDEKVEEGWRGGLRLRPVDSRSVVTRIKRVSLKAQEVGTVVVSLWKAGESFSDAESVDVEIEVPGVRVWVDVDWKLEAGADYFLSYEGAAGGTTGIDGRDASSVNPLPWARFMSILPTKMEAGNTFGDPSQIVMEQAKAYGFNLELSTSCELTSFVLDNIDAFARAAVLGVGISLLRELAFNPNSRINRNEMNVERAQIMYEIDGDTQGRPSSSLWFRYRSALKAIKRSASDIDPLCLPCNNKRGRRVRHKAIAPYPRILR